MQKHIMCVVGLAIAGVLNVGFGVGFGTSDAVIHEKTNHISQYAIEQKLASELVEELEKKISVDDPTDNYVVITEFVRQDWDSQPPVGSSVNRKLYIPRNPPNPGDTILGSFIINGRYIVSGTNFEPDAQPGETLYAFCYDPSEPSRNASTWSLLQDGANELPELCLDDPDKPGTAYTVNYKELCDTSSVTQSLPKYAESWVGKNPTQKDTVEVDTLNNGTFHWYDSWYNTELQDSVVSDGDTIYTTFFANLPGDSIAYTDVFAVVGVNTFGNAILGADTTWFPQHIGPLGVSEYTCTELET